MVRFPSVSHIFLKDSTSQLINGIVVGGFEGFPTLTHNARIYATKPPRPSPLQVRGLYCCRKIVEWRRLDGEGCKEGIVLF